MAQEMTLEQLNKWKNKKFDEIYKEKVSDDSCATIVNEHTEAYIHMPRAYGLWIAGLAIAAIGVWLAFQAWSIDVNGIVQWIAQQFAENKHNEQELAKVFAVLSVLAVAELAIGALLGRAQKVAENIVSGLTVGLAAGLTVGLAVGLTGLAAGLTVGLAAGLVGLAVGLVGLAAGLVLGLVEILKGD